MKSGLLLLALASLFVLVGCASEPSPTPRPTRAITSSPTPQVTAAPTPTQASTSAPRTVVAPDGRTYKQYPAPPAIAIDPAATYTAAVSSSKGDLTIELFSSEASRTVNSFVFLSREGFYNGLTFHRVIKGFMIQGGDPKGDGTGGPGYKFADETVTRRYTRGIVAMANSGPNTNGSQFFIVHGADAGLPPQYTIFGQVTSGLDALDRLADTPVTAGRPGGEVSVPAEALLIKSINITETKRR